MGTRINDCTACYGTGRRRPFPGEGGSSYVCHRCGGEPGTALHRLAAALAEGNADKIRLEVKAIGEDKRYRLQRCWDRAMRRVRS